MSNNIHGKNLDKSDSILDRLKVGRVKLQAEHAEGETKKLGNLRAGMSGIMSKETGDIAGVCHRKSLVRSLGLDIETIDDSKLMMFELGYASEDITYEILEKSLLPGEIMLREEEIPIEWSTPNGTKISGRPDIVICEQHLPMEGMDESKRDKLSKDPKYCVPKLGLELKSVHSIWTARDVLFGGKPKMGNLIQAAHYMWKLNIPYKLIYKSYSNLGQSMSDWAQKLFPKPGAKWSEYIDYNDKGGIKGTKQFEIAYDLHIDSKGRVCYKLEQDTEWIRSIVTVQDIELYFEYVSKMQAAKELGPRPMTIDCHGEKLNYKECAYCPLQKVCDDHEGAGYETWLEQVRKHSVTVVASKQEKSK